MTITNGDTKHLGTSEADEQLAHWVAELAERLEGGEDVDLEAFVVAHPERAEELRRILPTIQQMAAFAQRNGNVGKLTHSHEVIGLSQGFGTLGDFRLIREVGRGAMGIVYEANQISLQRRVALKILPLAAALDPRSHQRFLLEARAAACLDHTHIVPVYAVGSERGVPCYAMQFIDGCTLAKVLEQFCKYEHCLTTEDSTLPVSPGSPPAFDVPPTQAGLSLGTSHRNRSYIRAVANLGRQAADALDHAHSRGILHRDIKPSNLMLDRESHLWITDFGLARIQGDSHLTLTGDILGTLRYMSPEQALGKRIVIDGRTDLYSLGATLYESLTLRPVFDGTDRGEILRKIAQDEPALLRSLNPEIPRDLEIIIHKTLAKEPADRYTTARELALDLGRFLDSRPIIARPPPRLERLCKWGRRNRAILVPVTLLAAVSVLVLGAGLIWSNNRLRSYNEQLRIERDRAANLSKQLKTQRDLAEERRHLSAHHLYAFRLRQAAEAFRDRKFEVAQEILRDSRPAPGEEDLREFAWHALWRESRREIEILSERAEQTWTLALSPDGRTLATGDLDGTIALRGTATGARRITMRGPRLPVSSLSFSADGRRLASGSGSDNGQPMRGQGGLFIWDTASGQLLASLSGYEDSQIDPLRFSAAGEFLWVRSLVPQGQVFIDLWMLETGPDFLQPRLLKRWETLNENLALSKDGRRIALYENSRESVVVREAPSGRVLYQLPRKAWAYECVCFSPDGRLLAATWHDHSPGPVCKQAIWEADTGRLIAEYQTGPIAIISRIEFSPDGGDLIAQSQDGMLCCLHLASGESWAIDADPVDEGHVDLDFSFLPGGTRLARGYRGDHSGPQAVQIYNMATGSVQATFSGRVEIPNQFLGLADGKSLIFRSGTQAVLWRFEPADDPQPAGHADEAWAAGFSSDGHLLVTGSDDTDDPQTLKVWDVPSGRLIRGWKAHAFTTSVVAFQPGGTLVASAGLESTDQLRLWDSATGTLIVSLDGHTDKVRTVAFSPDGRLLASAGTDHEIRLWDVATRRCLRTLTGPLDTIRQVAFSPDGHSLAAVGNDQTVRLWEWDSTKPPWIWKGSSKIAAVAFSPDGAMLAWAHEDGIIQPWDLRSQQPLPPLHSEYEELRCLAFAPDGRTLAAAGKLGAIHFWDPVSGQELLTLPGQPCQVNALTFSPDGHSLAACWHDGTVRIIRSR